MATVISGVTSGTLSGTSSSGSSAYWNLSYNPNASLGTTYSYGTTSSATTGGSSSGVNWSYVGAGLNAVGGTVGVVATLYSAKQQARLYKQQAEQVLNDAEWQTQFNEFNNMLTQEAYAVERRNLQTEQEEHLAGMHVGFASEGVEMTGSARLVMAKQAEKNAEELQTMDKNALLSAYQTQLNSTATLINAEYEAKMLRIRAKYAKKAGYLNAFAQGFNTLASSASMIGMGK